MHSAEWTTSVGRRRHRCLLGLISTYVHPEPTWDEWDQVILRLISWRPSRPNWRAVKVSKRLVYSSETRREMSSLFFLLQDSHCFCFVLKKRRWDSRKWGARKCSTSWRFTRWWHGQLAAVNCGSNEQICPELRCRPAVALPSDTKRTNSDRTDETGVSKIPGHSLPFWERTNERYMYETPRDDLLCRRYSKFRGLIHSPEPEEIQTKGKAQE